jgi:hypothetical protein
MSYSQASREAGRLIAAANETGNWWSMVEKLQELRSIMARQMPDAA